MAGSSGSGDEKEKGGKKPLCFITVQNVFSFLLTLFGAHEEQFIAPPSPGGLDMLGLLLMVLWPCHNPAEDLHLFCQHLSKFILTLKEV